MKFEDRWGFNEWAETYDRDIQTAAQADDWIFKDYNHVLNKVIEYCELDGNEYSTVLDIGIGTGNLAGKFIERGLQVTGIEPSEAMRNICVEKYPQIPVLTGDFFNIPLPPDSVDLIVSTYSFHHVTQEDKEKIIPILRKLLKPKGKIIIADLMFKNESHKKEIIQSLLDLNKYEIVEVIKEEYPGYFDSLETASIQNGFSFSGEQLTDYVWLFCACI